MEDYVFSQLHDKLHLPSYQLEEREKIESAERKIVNSCYSMSYNRNEPFSQTFQEMEQYMCKKIY